MDPRVAEIVGLDVFRNAHKSVMSGVVVNGVEPIWVHPRFDIPDAADPSVRTLRVVERH